MSKQQICKIYQSILDKICELFCRYELADGEEKQALLAQITANLDYKVRG